jgi:hypothetical protein
MKPFELFIAYISWGSGGKRRPMLVYKKNDSHVVAFPITTRFANKSKAIQDRYYVINDWVQSGLEKQSYIDTGTPYVFSESALRNAEPIGRLTEGDKIRLIAFFLKR